MPKQATNKSARAKRSVTKTQKRKTTTGTKAAPAKQVAPVKKAAPRTHGPRADFGAPVDGFFAKPGRPMRSRIRRGCSRARARPAGT
jgi:hypothetical protein